MRVTGHSRRSIGSMPQSSVSLRHDASNEESAAIPLCNTTKGARKHFDANSARGSVDHLGEGAQVADTPYILKRQTRAKGASAPSSHSAEDFGADSNDAQVCSHYLFVTTRSHFLVYYMLRFKSYP